MPTTTHHGTGRAPRTLAEKLQWLRELHTPEGQQPPSYDATARQITAETGISISGPYYWELVTGRTTNPKLHHLQAIARFHNVPVGYLVETHTDFEQYESTLQRLRALRQRGVHHLTLNGGGAPDLHLDLTTIQTLLGRLAMLDQPATQELLDRLDTLNARQRVTLHTLTGDPALLDALADATLRDLLSRSPALLDALRTHHTRDAVLCLATLSDTSQHTAHALVRRLHDLEASTRT